LKHGVTGEGMNDYDAIFRILSSVGFGGWISIEDGMDGLGEIARSAAFLKQKRAQYYGDSGLQQRSM
jgi:sugar phosphate isomerase/epimerase